MTYTKPTGAGTVTPATPVDTVVVPPQIEIVGTLPDGLSSPPDNYGAVKFAGVNDGPNGRFGGQRWHTTAVDANLVPGSYAQICTDVNCQISQIGYAYPSGGGVMGGASYPLGYKPSPFVQGKLYLVQDHGVIPNTAAIPASLNTVEKAVAWLNEAVAANTNPNGGGGGFIPPTGR